MNVVCFAQVYRDDQPRVASVNGGAALRFAKVTPWLVRWFRFRISIVRQLHDAEGKIAFAPTLAPCPDHSRQQNLILLCTCFVRFTLIPNRTANVEGNQRRDHAVVDR